MRAPKADAGAVERTDARQLVDLVDVDELCGAGQAHGEQRHEALAAGEHLGLVAVLGEERERLVERMRGAWYSNGAFFMPAPPR